MIGIIYIQDIKNCPFLSKYEKKLKQLQIDYKVIYWNRKEKDGSGIFRNGKYVEYRKYQDVTISKRKKIRGFLEYRKFLIKEIKNCDKLIVLTTMSALIIFDVLLTKFRNNYIFDFRDPSLEKNKLFKYLIGILVKNSNFTCISSEDFKLILPDDNYYIAHNFRYEDIETAKHYKNKYYKEYGDCLNLVYFGAIREYDHICKQIELFADNAYFNLYYYGDGDSYSKVKEYVTSKHYKNIFVMGPYNNDEKINIITNTDIINNHYPKSNNYPICVSNKFYDSLIYKRPILSNVGGIDARNSKCAGIGIGLVLDKKQDIEDLYHWYFSLDPVEFNNNCEMKLKEILKDDDYFLMEIDKFLKK